MEDVAKSTWIVAALQQYESHLVRYATWILGDLERAREVVQETFLRLCRENESRVGGHLAQWLFTVCRNLAFDVRKKENRMSPLGDAEAAGTMFDRPLQNIEREEAMTQVLRIVETLPKNQREVIILRHFMGLTTSEIAQFLKRQPSAVYSLEARALARLRQELG